MSAPLVMILYNAPVLPANHKEAESEHSVVEIAGDMNKVLINGNYRTQMLGVSNPTELWNALQSIKPDVVFNLFEGSLNDPDTESHVAGLLQWSRIPFTGSMPTTLSVARAKHLTKRLLRGAGLPSSNFFVVEELPIPAIDMTYPLFVKPAAQDASVGVDQDSVVKNLFELEKRVQYIYETYGPPVMIEEYIRGREFNVALTELPELTYLPPAEIIFPEERPGYWPILTYEGKWMPGTPDYETTPPHYPAKISKPLARKLGTLAMKAYRLLGCRDYARVDFRVSPTNKPYILEVNPNPEISDSAGFAGCLGSAATKHEHFVLRLIEHALNRKTFEPTWALPTVTG